MGDVAVHSPQQIAALQQDGVNAQLNAPVDHVAGVHELRGESRRRIDGQVEQQVASLLVVVVDHHIEAALPEACIQAGVPADGGLPFQVRVAQVAFRVGRLPAIAAGRVARCILVVAYLLVAHTSHAGAQLEGGERLSLREEGLAVNVPRQAQRGEVAPAVGLREPAGVVGSEGGCGVVAARQRIVHAAYQRVQRSFGLPGARRIDVRAVAQVVIPQVLVRIARRGAQVEVGLRGLNGVAHQAAQIVTVAQLLLVVEGQLALHHLVLPVADGANAAFVQSQCGVRGCEIVLRYVGLIGTGSRLGRQSLSHLVAQRGVYQSIVGQRLGRRVL